MRKLIFFTIFLAGCAAMAQVGGQQPTVVPILNPSFEQQFAPDRFDDPCGLEMRAVTKIPAWTFTVVPNSGGAGGLLQPSGETPVSRPNGCNVPLPPDGQIVAFLQDTTMSQTVHVPDLLTGAGIYTLKFYAASYFYWYPGQYTASISMSDKATFYEEPWCSVSGHPIGDFKEVTLICPVNHYYAQDLTVSIYNKGWPTLFDNVSLTFTPVN